MRLIGQVLFLLSIFNSTAFAQESRQRVTERVSAASPQASPEITYKILDQLAQGQGKPSAKAELIISFDLTIAHTPVPGGLQCRAWATNFAIAGDNLYRGFAITGELFPYQINTSLISTDPTGRVIATIYTDDINRLSSYQAFYTIPHPYPTSVFLTTRPENIILGFEPLQLNFLREKIALINDYYATGLLLRDAQQKLNTLPPFHPDNLDLQSEQLQQIQNSITLARSKNYESLQLSMQDPDRFILNLTQIESGIASRRAALNGFYQSLDAYYYNKGLQEKMNRRNADAKRLFEKALAVNPRFAPAAIELAQLALEEGDLTKADLQGREVYFNTQVDQNTRLRSITLLKDLYSVYMQKASANSGKAIAQDDYLSQAEKLCREIPEVTCTQVLLDGLNKRRNEAFTILVREAASQLDKNLADARVSIDKADRFQRDNFNGNAKHQIDSLWDLYEVAEVESILKEGRQFTQKKDYVAAYGKASSALSKLKQYDLIPGPEVQEKIAFISKNIVIERIRALNNQPATDTGFIGNYRSLKLDIEEHYLMNDPEINASLKPLQDKYINAECGKVGAQISEIIKKAEEEKIKGNYIRQHEYLDEAIALSNGIPECALPSSGLEEQKSQTLPAATYQKLINKVIETQMENRLEQALTLYEESEKYYYQFDISQYGFKRKSIYDFAVDNFKNASLQSMANLYLKKNELDKSLSLYKLLLQRNANKNFMYEGLYKLGSAYGKRDKSAIGNYKSAKVKVLEYTQGDDDLVQFRRGYLSEF